jgi:hypothetical protein
MAKGLLLNYFFCEGCGICAMWPHDSDIWKISYFYFSGLEGVDRTRELPCLERGFEVLGVDSSEKESRMGGRRLVLSALSGVAC